MQKTYSNMSVLHSPAEVNKQAAESLIVTLIIAAFIQRIMPTAPKY